MKNHRLVTNRLEQRLGHIETWRWACECGETDKASSEDESIIRHDGHTQRVKMGGR